MSLKGYVWACDPIGFLLFISAATFLLLVLDWSGGAYAWSNAHVAAPLGVGFGYLALFCLYEWKERNDGLVAHAFFKVSPNFALSVFASAVEGWLFYSAVNSVTPQIVLDLGLYATKSKDLKSPLIFTFLIVTICYYTITPSMNHAQIDFNILSGISQSGPLARPRPVYGTPRLSLHRDRRRIRLRRPRRHHKRQARADLRAQDRPGGDTGWSTMTSIPALLEAMAKGVGLADVPGINAAVEGKVMLASGWAYAHTCCLAWASITPFVLALIAVMYLKELMTDKVEATVEHVGSNEKVSL